MWSKKFDELEERIYRDINSMGDDLDKIEKDINMLKGSRRGRRHSRGGGKKAVTRRHRR